MSQQGEKRSKLTKRLIVRVSDEDRARICASAQDAGLGVSEFVRVAALRRKVKARRKAPTDSPYGMSLAFQLRRVGVNLNQLTRVANTNGEKPEELARVCGLVERILDRIVRME